MIKRVIQYTLIISIFLSIFSLHAQTTGKIAGKVVDKNSGKALVGVNIIVKNEKGYSTGVATNKEGNYHIINLPPGHYQLKAEMIGYQPVIVEDIEVSINRTRNINLELEQGTVQGEAIIVEADQIYVKKDQTSSIRNISADDIEALPVENINTVINMQAGVVAGHFRGGRNTEVSYMIDGLQVDEGYHGRGQAINVEPEAVKDIEVITGTFNAEYGRAMSGIVNIVTKEGNSERLTGYISSAFANYFTRHQDVFFGLDPLEHPTLNLSQDYKFQISGPIFGDKLTFFYNMRYQDNNGYLNGIRRFDKRDYNDYSSPDSSEWHTEHTGDSSYVSMQNSKNLSMMGKLTFKPISELKISLLYSMNDDEGQGYDHYYKYNPDFRGTGYNNSSLYALTMNHMINNNIFHEMKISWLYDKNQGYKFKDPLDERYVHPNYRGTGGTGFNTGGITGPGKSTDIFADLTIKYDFNWQINSHHHIKTGVQYIAHTIDKNRVDVRNKWEGTQYENKMVIDSVTGDIDFPYYELEIDPITEKDIGVYEVHPFEYSAYFQDKMEFNEMVINAGLRYDYFNSNHIYPTDRRNPSNQLNLPDSMMSDYKDAKPQFQLSPRLGLAYQLGNAAVLHFSYGHFFQMPRMKALYANNRFRVPTSDYATIMGNTILKPQKTVSYEIGLWQELITGMGLEIALYYKDIYNLLSTRIVSTYNQIKYGLYTNKDYGNTRGIELKWDYSINNFYANANYTLQYTRGNADNPEQTYNRAGNSMDPIKRLIPMSWDQRHTFNFTVSYATKKYGATLTGYYNSGTPYTYEPLPESPLSFVNLYQNNDWKPGTYSIDIKSFYNLDLSEKYQARLFMSIYNLLDFLNPLWVYNDTGQPYTTIVREHEKNNHRSDFNTYLDAVQDPSAYGGPFHIKLGLKFKF
jgi:outer membrane receptor protein involved in Fe transport